MTWAVVRVGRRPEVFVRDSAYRSASEAVFLLQRRFARQRLARFEFAALDAARQLVGKLQVQRRRRKRIDHTPNARTSRTCTIMEYVLDVQDV